MEERDVRWGAEERDTMTMTMQGHDNNDDDDEDNNNDDNDEDAAGAADEEDDECWRRRASLKNWQSIFKVGGGDGDVA
jgi:hypothetical protein